MAPSASGNQGRRFAVGSLNATPERMLNLLLATASVLLTVLAFPPHGVWPAGCVMLAPLVMALERSSRPSSFLLAYGYSIAMALVIVRWLVYALAVEYQVPLAAAWAFTILLVAAYALLPAVAALAYHSLRPRCGPLLAAPLFAAIWTLAEWLRSEPGALPWLLAGHTLAPLPLVLQTADLGGVYAVSFLVVVTSAALGLALARRSIRPLLIPAAFGIAALGYGALRLTDTPTEEASVRVGVVQASVPQGERFRPGSAERNTRRHAELTRELLSRERVDLVVWSETAVDADLDASPVLRSLLARLVAETGTPLVTGAPRSRGGRRVNSVVLLTPDGQIRGAYDKQRLVPFSEYDPPLFWWLAPLLGPVSAGEPYSPGREPVLLRGAPLRLATPICFEITYPNLVRTFHAVGAELMVNLSNDAWFGRTGYAEMHFLHAVFRAVELRTWVVRAANTGISGVIDPAGRVLDTLPVFADGTLVASVGRAGAPGLYARAGDPPLLVALTGVILISTVRRRQAR